METVELVIRIPREDYALIMSGRFYLGGSRGNGKTITSNLMESICRGTLLPSGHGRLIDVDKMIADFVDSQAISLEERFKISNIVEHQKTIIEEDKEGAEE